MAMGTRKGRERQEELWVAYADMATGPGHPFYVRLNEVLDGEGFDAFVALLSKIAGSSSRLPDAQSG
jgi:transposase